LLARHSRLAKFTRSLNLASEEILASLIGSLICYDTKDQFALLAKCFAELLVCGVTVQAANRQLHELRELLKVVL
jgi:hypothetical protein